MGRIVKVLNERSAWDRQLEDPEICTVDMQQEFVRQKMSLSPMWRIRKAEEGLTGLRKENGETCGA